MTAGRAAMFRTIYRAHQILHTMAFEVLSHLTLFHITAGGLMMITSFYSAIQLPWKRSNFPILLRVGLSGVMAVIQFTVFQVRARTILVNSENYPTSFLLNNPGITQYDRCFLKSCRPLRFQTGPALSFCRRDFFLIYMEGFVVSNTVNLLLTFK